jgi:hypothetical protein
MSLCLTKHYTMKTYWEWRYSSTHSLTSALDGGEWSASRPGRFIPKERTPGTRWIGGWVGPRAVLDAVMKRKIPSPHGESKPRTPDRPARSTALYRLSYRGYRKSYRVKCDVHSRRQTKENQTNSCQCIPLPLHHIGL